ncbi:MAG: adenosylmethionine decarboxylase [Armatimonadetes bacterium]|nr:adenosylmethionine decarboxylase [Armatimonadota bacterium]
MPLTYLGHHIVLDMHECDANVLADHEAMRTVMRVAAELAGCHVVGEFYHEFEPHGTSGCTIISESHFTVHAWPEYKYAAIDLFYCGNDVEISKAERHIAEQLGATRVERHELARGAMQDGTVVTGAMLIAGENLDK